MATEFISNSWLMPNDKNQSKFENYGLTFDGSGEYIDCTNDILVTGTTSFSFWFKADNTTQFSTILDISDGTSTNRIWIGLYTGNIWAFAGKASSARKTTLSYSADTWYHIVVNKTASADISDIYVNGVAETLISSGTSFGGSHSGFRIGRQIGYSTPFDGSISQVSIFDYSLSSSQITQLYGTGSAIGNPMAITNGRKPVAYYPLGNAGFNGEFLTPNSAEKDFVFDFVPNDAIDISNDINITSNFSYSFWYRSESTGSQYEFLLSRENAAASVKQFALYRHGNGKLYANIYDSSGTLFSTNTGSVVSANTWHNVVFCYSPSNYIRLYLDGVLKGENTTSIPSSLRSITGESIRIGGRRNNTMFLNGQMSNVQMWSGTLTDGSVSVGATSGGEVATLYNNGTPYTGTQPQAANLQGWWELDASATFDGSNWSIPDASSNSNTGTSSGMSASSLVQSDLIINAPFDSMSLQMDGTDEYINCGNVLDQTGTDTFSVSGWLKYNTTKSNTLVGKMNSSFVGYQIYINAANKLKFLLQGTGNLSATGATALSTNTWYHIVVTYDGTGATSGINFYINGTSETFTGSGSNSGGVSNSENFEIGARTGTSDVLDGSISNVSIYSSELSAAQVKTLYNEHKPFDLNTFAVTPVSWWRLGSVNTFYNSTTTEFTVLDEIGTNNGTSANMEQSDLVDGVGATGSGLSSGMSSGTNRTGNAPYSDNNAVSYNMSVTAKSTSVPT